VADRDFVIKNGLVVGDTATINGVQIDPSGATSGKVLKFDGTKFAPASEGDISGTVYSTTIGDGTNSSYTITHGFGTRNVVVVIRNATSPYEVINARWEATTTNTITVDFSSPVTSDSVIVSVYSTVSGTAVTAIDDLSDIIITSVATGDFLKWNGTAWVNDAIDLGTDTTGNYVASLIAGTGITLANNSGEGATPTVTVNTSVIAPLASPALTGIPTAPTAAANTNTTQIATTAFVTAAVSGVSGGGGDSISAFLLMGA